MLQFKLTIVREPNQQNRVKLMSTTFRTPRNRSNCSVGSYKYFIKPQNQNIDILESMTFSDDRIIGRKAYIPYTLAKSQRQTHTKNKELKQTPQQKTQAKIQKTPEISYSSNNECLSTGKTSILLNDWEKDVSFQCFSNSKQDSLIVPYSPETHQKLTTESKTSFLIRKRFPKITIPKKENKQQQMLNGWNDSSPEIRKCEINRFFEKRLTGDSPLLKLSKLTMK